MIVFGTWTVCVQSYAFRLEACSLFSNRDWGKHWLICTVLYRITGKGVLSLTDAPGSLNVQCSQTDYRYLGGDLHPSAAIPEVKGSLNLMSDLIYELRWHLEGKLL